VQAGIFLSDYPMIDSLQTNSGALTSFIGLVQPLPDLQQTTQIYGNSLKLKEGLVAAWKNREDFRKFMIFGYGIMIGLCAFATLIGIGSCCSRNSASVGARLITTIIHFVLVAVTFFAVSLALRIKFLSYHNSFSFIKEDYDSYVGLDQLLDFA